MKQIKYTLKTDVSIARFFSTYPTPTTILLRGYVLFPTFISLELKLTRIHYTNYGALRREHQQGFLVSRNRNKVKCIVKL